MAQSSQQQALDKMVLDATCKIGKRMRDADEEVYLDNFHTNKRYLTEVISSSLNGLKVGDVEDISREYSFGDVSESPSTALLSKSTCVDDSSAVDSAMSDDSEESVGYRTARICDPTSSPDRISSGNTSPIRTLSRSYSCPPTPSSSFHVKQRSYEGRLPPSPSDPCQQPNLRRAALMRATHLRARSPGGCIYDTRVQQILTPSLMHRQSARSLLLEEKAVESCQVEEEEEMDDVQNVTKRKGSECCYSRLKKGKPRPPISSSDISDTESSL